MTNDYDKNWGFVTPFQVLHFVQNFCTRCEALLNFNLEGKRENPDINLLFAFTITKCASKEWC